MCPQRRQGSLLPSAELLNPLHSGPTIHLVIHVRESVMHMRAAVFLGYATCHIHRSRYPNALFNRAMTSHHRNLVFVQGFHSGVGKQRTKHRASLALVLYQVQRLHPTIKSASHSLACSDAYINRLSSVLFAFILMSPCHCTTL